MPTAHIACSIPSSTSSGVQRLQDTSGAVLFPGDKVADIASDGETLLAVTADPPVSSHDDEPTPPQPVSSQPTELAVAEGEVALHVHALHCGQYTTKAIVLPATSSFLALQIAVSKSFSIDEAVSQPLLFTAAHPLSPTATSMLDSLSLWGLVHNTRLFCVFRPRVYVSEETDRCWDHVFFADSFWQPAVHQDEASLAVFVSALCVVSAQLAQETDTWSSVLGCVRRLTAFPPAALALNYLRHRIVPSFELCAALSEAFYYACRTKCPPSIGDSVLFSSSRHVWAHIFDDAKPADGQHEQYESRVYDEAESSVLIKGTPPSMRVPQNIILSWIPSPEYATLLDAPMAATEASGRSANWHQAEAELGMFRFLRIVPALGLRSSQAPVMTWSASGHVAVYTGRTSSVVLSCQLMDPVRKMKVDIDPNEQAMLTKRYESLEKTTYDARPTTEAIMILFDASHSMSLVWTEGLSACCIIIPN